MNGILKKFVDTFAQKIEYVRRGPVGVPKLLNINLADVATDRPYDISGNMFFVWQAPDESAYVRIKINESGEPAIPYQVHCGIRTPFDRLLITTPAGQTGNIQIIYGTEAPDMLELIDNRSTTVAGVGGVLAELRGDLTHKNYTGVNIAAAPGATQIAAANGTRKSIIVQALSTNTGSVFLGFDNTVTVGGAPGTWFAELQPGQSYSVDDYRGPIYGIATAAEVVGMGEV